MRSFSASRRRSIALGCGARQLAVPSLPAELITTGCVEPPTETPLTPARKAAVCLSLVPIRIVPDSPATPGLAMSMLLEPVVRF